MPSCRLSFRLALELAVGTTCFLLSTTLSVQVCLLSVSTCPICHVSHLSLSRSRETDLASCPFTTLFGFGSAAESDVEFCNPLDIESSSWLPRTRPLPENGTRHGLSGNESVCSRMVIRSLANVNCSLLPGLCLNEWRVSVASNVAATTCTRSDATACDERQGNRWQGIALWICRLYARS